jgi:hypothetical protein
MMQRVSRGRDVKAPRTSPQAGAEASGDVSCGPVVDSPERADHMRVARQLEGRGEVDRFVEQVSGLVTGLLS